MTIAFLGIGLMGRPMAERLLGAGFALAAWNRTPAKALPLAGLGARVVATPAEAAADAEFVVTMLADGPAVAAVLFDGGVAAALRRNSIVIDMSSIAPATARDHAARLMSRGIAQIDAPVSGGPYGAASGTLAIMAGGEEAAFQRAQPVMAPLGRAIRVGPPGAGQIAKLGNQTIVAAAIGAVAEALLLAAANGADPAKVRDALGGGFADSKVLQIHGGRMLARDFVPGGHARTHLKDLEATLIAAAEAGLELPLARRLRDLFAALVAHGDGALDQSALLLEIERMNAPQRLGAEPDRRG